MTFEQFAKAVKHFDDTIRVYRHEKVGAKVSVYFGDSGEYRYSGSYHGILLKLGFDCTTSEWIAQLEHRLEEAKAWHGKINIFTHMATDNTTEIDELTTEIERLKTLYIVD